jgi:RHS repeat-associated protein
MIRSTDDKLFDDGEPTVVRRNVRGDGPVDRVYWPLDVDAETIHDLIDDLPASDNANAAPFLYDGHDFDPEVGLQSNRSRHYDPETGRWLNLDPIGYEADVNLYRYAGNAPCNDADPTTFTASTDQKEHKRGHH